MLKKTKQILLIACVIFLSVLVLPHVSHATDHRKPVEEILLLEKNELILELQKEGLVLPEYYEDHQDIAQNFIHKFTPLLLDGSIDTTRPVFNFTPSNELLISLQKTLSEAGYLASKPSESRYTLQNSTTIGSWSSTYTNYNCYAYSIGRTQWRQPNGGGINSYYDVSKPISSIADDVLSDLDSLGYWGYKTTTKPTSLPDSHFRVICVRKDTDNFDYHFMKKYGTLNSWAHKPSWTQPLKWNYSSPGAAVWTNEAVADGYVYAPSITYESTIYYILYKGKNDPGIQLRGVSAEEIERLITEPNEVFAF